MRNRELVYKSLEIIEGSLKKDFNVSSICQEFGFSRYYFSRIFKGVTGYSLKEYILMRKINEAYNDIINTNKKIIDIAFEYGFNNHESFSRAFYRILGFNPSEARKGNHSISPFPSMTREVIENSQKNNNQDPEIVDLEEILLIGVPFYFDLTLQNDLSKPWNNLIKNTTLIENRILPEKYYQVQYWFPDQEIDFFYFFIALQVDIFDTIPIQFTAKTIPKQKYLKFTHRGKSNTVGETYKFIYERYLPEKEYKLPYFYNFEYYGDQFIDPYDSESISEIYIPIKGER